MISLLKYLSGPWERVRGYLAEDLQTIESAFNQQLAAATVVSNLLTPVGSTVAPSTTAGVGIANYYGTSAANFLGTPDAWLLITSGGTTYKLPLYR